MKQEQHKEYRMAAPKSAAPEKESPPTPLKAFKGFDQDLKCRGFQFADGQTFEHDGPVRLCGSGFHAVTSPLDVLNYYPPATSVYRVVELDEVSPKREGDSKVVARKLTMGASINLVGLARAHVEFVRENVDKSKAQTKVGETASNTGDYSAASNTGYYSAASNTGYHSAASNTGDYSAASNTGDYSAASNTGDYSAASNTGYHSAASNTGYHSAASNTGNRSAASNTGYQSAASVKGEESVAIVTGYDGKAAGSVGCWIVLTERDTDMHIVEVKAFKVDGKKVKADVFYKLVSGKAVTA